MAEALVSGAPAVALDGDDEVALPEDAVEVGRVLGAYGIKGWIRVAPHAKDPKALFSSRRWFVAPPSEATAGAATAARPRLLRVAACREQGDAVVAGVRDVDDRDAAQAFAGWRVLVARSSFPSVDDGEYYWVDLIGLTVVDRDGAVLGTVAALLDTGAHSVLQLEPGARLLPFVGVYIDSVDLAARRIVADWRAEWWD